MPWRRDPSPYHVLLSEFMCQQTRIDTAIPYFERFRAKWPTLQDLAGASEQEVVDEWAGLGYYRRARFLHRAAVAAAEQGGLPQTADELRKLPGIGPYTAGALASIAFGQVEPLVDGNVERVLSRLDDLDADPRSPAGRKALWARARALVDPDAPGDFNQALMELGATLCTPRKPRCGDCPVSELCKGRHRAETLPRKAPRKKPVPIREVAAIARRDGVLLGRRPVGGLLGGLWEPLRATPGEDESTFATACRAVAEGAGLDARAVADLGSIVHVFSHRRLTLELVEVVVEPGEPVPGTYQEVRWCEPESVALSRLGEKAVEASAQAAQLALLAAEPTAGQVD